MHSLKHLLMAAMTIMAACFAHQSPAVADPSGTPTANRIFYDCTFRLADLRSSLNIPNASLTKFFGDNIQASYIVIYVRANPNDGQRMDGTPAPYTGPILCTNEATENIFATTEATQIPNAARQPNATSVDILGGEEALHLQY